jgi:hypothetical protein
MAGVIWPGSGVGGVSVGLAGVGCVAWRAPLVCRRVVDIVSVGSDSEQARHERPAVWCDTQVSAGIAAQHLVRPARERASRPCRADCRSRARRRVTRESARLASGPGAAGPRRSVRRRSAIRTVSPASARRRLAIPRSVVPGSRARRMVAAMHDRAMCSLAVAPVCPRSSVLRRGWARGIAHSAAGRIYMAFSPCERSSLSITGSRRAGSGEVVGWEGAGRGSREALCALVSP